MNINNIIFQTISKRWTGEIFSDLRDLITSAADLDDETLVRERRLLYVAMTRAKFVLYMTFYDKLSRFFAEMDSSLYSNKKAVM